MSRQRSTEPRDPHWFISDTAKVKNKDRHDRCLVGGNLLGVYRLRSVDGKRVAPQCLNPQPDGTQAWAIRNSDGLKIELTGKELPERG